jgi:F0F1-type ATP synthase membrane subunit b/b'
MSDERNRILLEWFEDKAFLGKWISTVENLVQDILDDAERNLENIRNVLTSLLEQLQAAEERALRMLPSLI